MIRPFLLLAFAVSATVSQLQNPVFPEGWASTDPTEPSPLGSRLGHVVRVIDDIREIGGTAGMSIGVMYQGKVVLERHLGFADVENAAVATSNTRYPLGSLTKSFVAATVAQLVEDGLLEWEAPITTYLPELSFDSDPSLSDQLTLVDLLSHRTGLVRLDSLWLGADGQVNIRKNETIRMCNHLFAIRPHRSGFLYNNWMYALAGQIIERVTNSSFGEALAALVLDKAGLSQTTLMSSDLPPNSTALPYLILDHKLPARMAQDLGMMDGSLMSSAGGIRSTVHDMLSWGHALLGPFRNDSVLSRQLDALLSGHNILNSSRESDELYGLGLAKVIMPAQFGKLGFNPGLVNVPVLSAGTRTPLVFYHNGAISGYNNCFMLIPELQAVIVILTNSIAQGDVADWAAQTLLQAVLNSPSPIDLRPLAQQAADKWTTFYQTMSDELERDRIPNTEEPKHPELVGTYRHETGALALEVFEMADSNILKFNINGEQSQVHTLTHYHNASFIFLPPSDAELIGRGLFHYGTDTWLLHFKRDSGGRMDRIIWNLDGEAPAGETFVKLED
ncbi:hypothetical protein GGTG_13909 [Gaeumannomyces tritici R3-111a-1]|uniref:Beta-lactamase-related domain-containing protein n=1 Tax=Gaeumannomyces tritici (strain R3-111a-1) TaxID=644352 RepID=J3PK62_GAET3|nr:hypothetical protein GGTG_13909 [Gaeumannomyces tritici R3-111a-1]EJT68511.1 hypothetical protein GGTG_13909 [Gaeumannomyces tritici R3-111a-1]